MFGLKPGNGLHASRTAAVMRWAVIATVCPALVISCGYRFAGSGGPPRGIEKLYIALLDNKTTESGIDILTTNALKNEFIHKYRGVLVGRETATAILSGSVTGIRTETVSSRGSLTSLERRIYMTVDLALKSTASGQIWFEGTKKPPNGISAMYCKILPEELLKYHSIVCRMIFKSSDRRCLDNLVNQFRQP